MLQMHRVRYKDIWVLLYRYNNRVSNRDTDAAIVFLLFARWLS